jgi:hypothetical protein
MQPGKSPFGFCYRLPLHEVSFTLLHWTSDHKVHQKYGKFFFSSRFLSAEYHLSLSVSSLAALVTVPLSILPQAL